MPLFDISISGHW